MVGVKMGTFGKDDTFVTGGGVPGRMRTAAAEEPEEEEEKEFEWAEDKLLDDNDKTERDFQEMMNNLNRMDNMMHGDDLRYIR
jgi:hypothetical protein